MIDRWLLLDWDPDKDLFSVGGLVVADVRGVLEVLAIMVTVELKL